MTAVLGSLHSSGRAHGHRAVPPNRRSDDTLARQWQKTRGVSHPFDQKFIHMPAAVVLEFMAPAMTNTLDNLWFLADTIDNAGSKTHGAIADALKRSSNEVVAQALLAGADTVYTSYRNVFRSQGADLRASVDGIVDAWAVFGSTGHWTCPPRPAQFSTIAPTHEIQVADARPLTATECISAGTTDAVITAVTNATDNLVQAGGRIFSDLVKLEIPVGDLLDAVDTAGIHYSHVFAPACGTETRHRRTYCCCPREPHQIRAH